MPDRSRTRAAAGLLRGSLIDRVPRDHRDSSAALVRRRLVVAVTLVAGAALLAYSLRLDPGDDRFYVTTLVLAAVWTTGALLSGRLHLGYYLDPYDSRARRPVVQPLVVGVLLVAVFAAGALLVAQIPPLKDSVEQVLAHGRSGSWALVVVVTLLNGIAEEVFFRGAMFAALPERTRLWWVTGAYVLTVVGTGSVMLVFAALVLGLVTGAQRIASGGLLAPIITHVVWSSGMLAVLPALL